MAELLEKKNSSYFPAFKELFKETVSAFEEAQNIDIHLKPLSGYFESLETTEFDEVVPIFAPMFKTICLVWSNSKYYCRPARIIVLLQEINNSMIKRANEYLEPIDLFKGELEESLEKIRVCFNCLEEYEKTFNEYKDKVGSFFKSDPKPWDFSPKMVFARWDKFIERMNMIRVSSFSSYHEKLVTNFFGIFKEFIQNCSRSI
jgi:dynein heavy chain